MRVLGIETSCDETSVAVVAAGRRVLANETASSLRLHAKYGGVIPEIASRMQLETIVHVADSALEKAGSALRDIGLISVTAGPGLLGSLLVGISFAKGLSLSAGIPLLGVDHVHSHLYANFLDSPGVKLPFIALVVSGGHTNLYLVRDFDRISLLGRTVDDACGEAFDKAARIMGLGYPGGPAIEKHARGGNPKAVAFRCCNTKNALDFSFSGIKTAVLYYLRERGFHPGTPGARTCPPALTAEVAASFQETVIDALIRKSLTACEVHSLDRLVIGGGVVMNKRLRSKFSEACAGENVNVYFPAPAFCTDNAAMVAGFGYQLHRKGLTADLRLNAALS